MRSNYVYKVVKLGGSIITFKDRPMSIRYDVIKFLASELAEFLKNYPNVRLVLIHGGGSFGHYTVRECLNTKGEIDVSCFSKTSYVMTMLNTYLVKEFINAGLKPVSIPPHVIFRREGGQLIYEPGLIVEYLMRGFMPVLYGDVILGDQVFEVLSGDTIAWLVAKDLGAKELIFATDVDGLFDKDPKKYLDAKLIEFIRADDLTNLNFSTSDYDVTGSMMLKLMDGLKYGVKGVKVRIINGLVSGNLYKSLVGSSTVGTVVEY
ncbi:MAG: isopentenyl phosphate kinase [Sulfolobales archaeon]